MLGQPVSMLIPQVVGFRLHGKLREGATATDLVLTVTQMLRKTGVVGKFVEFFGAGLATLPLADRATIANMAPEYGATCGIFPVDAETLRYLRLTGRPASRRRAGRGVRARAGPVPRPDDAGGRLHRRRRARSRHRRAERRRARSARRIASACSRRKQVVRGRAAQPGQAEGQEEAGGGGCAARRRHQRRLRAGVEAVTRREERLGRHRGDHQLHEHVEPVGDGGRGPRWRRRRSRRA